MNNKLAMSLSLLANLALVVALGVSSRNTNKKVEAQQASDLQECKSAIKTVVKIGYLGGCMTAISQAKQLEQGDPLIPIYMDYCMQGAQSMAEKVELK